MQINKNGYLRLLSNRTSMLLQERGGVEWAFKRIKINFYEDCKRDSIFVDSMMKNITNICSLYERNKNWAISHHLYSWRQHSKQLKVKEEETLVQVVRSMVDDIIPCLSPCSDL